MTRMRDPKRSTSSSTWLETITVLPSSPRRRNNSMDRSRWRGSSPSSGSSRTSRSGSLTRAWASLTRWRMPLEYGPRGRRSAGSSSTDFDGLSAAARRARAVGAGWRPGRRTRRSSGARRGAPAAERCRCAGSGPGSRVGSSPKMRTVPCDGLARPHRMRKSVDLPAPFGTEQGGDARADVEAEVGQGHHRAEPFRQLAHLEWSARSRHHLRHLGGRRPATTSRPAATRVTHRRWPPPPRRWTAACWSVRTARSGGRRQARAR